MENPSAAPREQVHAPLASLTPSYPNAKDFPGPLPTVSFFPNFWVRPLGGEEKVGGWENRPGLFTGSERV